MSRFPRETHGFLAIAGVLGCLLASLLVASVIVYAGLYNVAADVPHTGPVYWLLETVRERSIAVRAPDIVVPDDLADPNRIASGAGQYAEMCASCHLAPGMKGPRSAAVFTRERPSSAVEA